MPGDGMDALIIGGGPIGCYTADLLARQGRKVGIIEEHRDIGWPMQCAGLLSTRVFDILDFAEAKKAVQNKVRGARLFSPKGDHADIMADRTKAYVVDRNQLDKEIALKALASGAELRIGTRAVGAQRTVDHRVKVELLKDSKKSALDARVVVGADGAQSSVARWFGLSPPPFMFSSFEAELTNIEMPSDMVYLFLSQKLAPGFFAWVIPLDDLTARVGLASIDKKHNSRFYFDRMMRSKVFKKAVGWERKRPPQPTRLMTGSIPMGLVDRMYADNALLVGDTAGLPKPASGGGVYTGLISARFAAQTIEEAFEKDRFNERILKKYQKRVLKKIGSELKNSMILRKVYTGVTDEQIEEGFAFLKDPEIVEFISKHGDIDYPYKLGKKMFTKMPRLFRFVGPYLKGTILGQ